jgi:hypothetical protein
MWIILGSRRRRPKTTKEALVRHLFVGTKMKSYNALVTNLISLAFLGLAVAFVMNLWGHPAKSQPIALVDTNYIDTATVRMSAGELIASGCDASGLDCYACHDHAKPAKLKFDDQNNVILADEHKDLIMGHGSHNRNNNCYNCHNETNLDLLQTRDGTAVKFVDSPSLCGSCHGPTYRDWEAGVHGRTSGFWDRDLGPINRKVCTSCHNPHSPAFPPRHPAPGPHALHALASVIAEPKGTP